MAVFWEGVAGILVCYVIILFIGIWAGRKMQNESELETMNAGRRFGAVIGTMTLVGTWAGGSYIVGSAEKTYEKGVLEVQAPIGYSVALIIGSLFFIKPMRDANYITMLDLFQEHYGRKYGASLIIPALLGEFFWIASVLNSLGTALRVILELEMWICIVVSGLFAGLYTIFGGLTSVSYTDVAQLILIVAGMLVVIPFAYINEQRVKYVCKEKWLGHLEGYMYPVFIEEYVLLSLGAIPWQGYFQRIFSLRSTEVARNVSYISFCLLLVIAIPAILIGVVGLETDWTKVPGFEREIEEDEYSLVLPLTLRYLTPKWAAVMGLSAISGAVMSSADSAILASSALFSRNIYHQIIRTEASDRELHITLRVAIVIVTISASILAIFVNKVYYLSVMCSDIVYVVLFPQLLASVYFADYSNAYGSAVAYFFSSFFRVLAGEKNLYIPTLIKFPGYSEEKDVQYFPFRTCLVIISFLLILAVSALTEFLFVTKAYLSPKFDIMFAFPDIHEASEEEVKKDEKGKK